MLIAALALAATLQSAAPAEPAPPAPAVVSPPKAKAPPADPVICEDEMVTGSMFSKRTCRTKSEWARIHDDSMNINGENGNNRRYSSPHS